MVHVHYNEGGDGSVHSAEVVVKEGPLGGSGGVVLVGGDEDGVDWADLVAVVEEASGKLVGGSEPIPLRKTGNGTDAQNIDPLELALHPLLLKETQPVSIAFIFNFCNNIQLAVTSGEGK